MLVDSNEIKANKFWLEKGLFLWIPLFRQLKPTRFECFTLKKLFQNPCFGNLNPQVPGPFTEGKERGGYYSPSPPTISDHSG